MQLGFVQKLILGIAAILGCVAVFTGVFFSSREATIVEDSVRAKARVMATLAANARRFLRDLERAAPMKITRVPTDIGMVQCRVFRIRAASRSRLLGPRYFCYEMRLEDGSPLLVARAILPPSRRAVRPPTSPSELRSVPGFCNFPSFKMDFETVAKKRRWNLEK